MENNLLLKVEHLKKYYKIKRHGKKQIIKAVDDVSFYLNTGQSFAIIGQSGSGKSTLLKLVFGLEKPDDGKVDFLCKVGIVFQDPYASLCPGMKVFDLVAEPVTMHGKMKDKAKLAQMVKESLQDVGLDFDAIANRYPHQISGGQKQRVAIARALITKPKLLVLDEPTSMLDADVKSDIVNILKKVKNDIAILLVTHDITLAVELCDYVFVMKDGVFIEQCFANELLNGVKESYTKNLILAAMDIQAYWQNI